MSWWGALVVLPSAYVLVNLGPWVALQLVERIVQRRVHLLTKFEERLRVLRQARVQHVPSWPEEPRPGRYREPDRLAQQGLDSLQAAIGEVERRWPTLAFYAPSELAVVDVLSLGSWAPLFEVVTVWRNVRAVQQLLTEAEQEVATLLEQERIVLDIPNKVCAELDEASAGLRRLEVMLISEEEAGTQGLRELAPRMQAIGRRLEESLAAITHAQPPEKPQVVSKADEVLAAYRHSVEEISHLLSAAAAQRVKAHAAIAETEHIILSAEERWDTLKKRGAEDPSISRVLSTFRDRATQLAHLMERRTPKAYRRVGAQATELSAELEGFMGRLDTLEKLMDRGAERLEGASRAREEALVSRTELERNDPELILDQMSSLIDEASDMLAEAEREYGKGTIGGYEAAISLSQEAMKHLQEGEEAAALAPERIQAVRELLGTLSAEALVNWRDRAERVREGLQFYATRWNENLAESVTEAISHLGRVEAVLQQFSADGRPRSSFCQSEMAEALDLLTSAREEMERAKERIEVLEGEEQRLTSLRQEFEEGVQSLNSHAVPEMREFTSRMLPHLQERLDALLDSIGERDRALDAPGQIDYDEATAVWLPSIRRQMEGVRVAHEKSLHRSRRILHKTIRRIDRKWTKLDKLELNEEPGLVRAISELARDLEGWYVDAERHVDNPHELQDIVGSRAAALEARMTEAYRQATHKKRERARGSLSRQARGDAETVGTLGSTHMVVRGSQDVSVNGASNWRGVAVALDGAEAGAAGITATPNEVGMTANRAELAGLRCLFAISR